MLRLFRTLVIGALVAAAWLVEIPIAAAQNGAVIELAQGRVMGHSIARAVEGGRPVGVERMFPADTNPIVFWFRHEDLAPGTILRSALYSLSAVGAHFMTDAETAAEAPDDWAMAVFSLREGMTWPMGRYRIDLFVAGARAGSAQFQICDAPATEAAAGEQEEPRLFDVGTGSAFSGGRLKEIGHVFDTETKDIYVWFHHSGLPDGAVLRGIWSQLTDAGPKPFAEAELVVTQPSDWGNFKLHLDEGNRLEAGRYQVDIRYNGGTLARVDFEIAFDTAP